MSTWGSSYLTKYKALEIDGKSLPCPQAVQVTRDMVQSANTKRTSNAKMRGTNIAVKASFKMSFSPELKPAEIEKIVEIVTSMTFEHTMKITNEFSKTEELNVYFGEYSADQHAFIGGRMINQSLSFKAVEI